MFPLFNDNMLELVFQRFEFIGQCIFVSYNICIDLFVKINRGFFILEVHLQDLGGLFRGVGLGQALRRLSPKIIANQFAEDPLMFLFVGSDLLETFNDRFCIKPLD